MKIILKGDVVYKEIDQPLTRQLKLRARETRCVSIYDVVGCI